MSGNNENLRERLLSLEPLDPELHDRYQKEMEKMFTQEITGMRKVGGWARDMLLLILGFALIGGALLNKPFLMPPAGRWLWVFAGVLNIGIALMGIRITLKKKMDLRKDSNLIARLGFAGLFVLSFALLFVGFMSKNLMDLVTIAPMSLLFIILAILLSVDNRVQQSELNIREKLLEMQLQLSELQKERNSKG